LFDFIVKNKQACHNATEISINSAESSQKEFERVYAVYQDFLDMQGRWDYEDLIDEVVGLFEKDSAIRREFQQRYPYVFVDEYQDLNQAQYRIVKQLTPSGKHLCVIGDPNQAIYAFRGANVGYFNSFVEDYPDASVIHLSQNYRSTQIILDASQQVVGQNTVSTPQDKLTAHSTGKMKLQFIQCRDEKNEAVFVGKTIEQQVGGIGFYSVDFDKIQPGNHKKERSFSDFAVLYRTAKQAKIFMESFGKAGIPYQVASKEDTYGDPVVLALISLLKIIGHRGSFLDFERINDGLGLGLSKRTLEIWKQWAFGRRYTLVQALENIRRYPLRKIHREQQRLFDEFSRKLRWLKNKIHTLSVREAFQFLIEQPQLKPKIARQKTTGDLLNALLTSADDYVKEMDRFLQSWTLQTDADMYRVQSEKVSLMTFHAAKGLEFPVVFIVGCENGFLPHRRTKGKTEEAEERRLLYVAMTRAKESLYISFSRKRNIYGSIEKREPSPFLASIARSLTAVDNAAADSSKRKKHQQLQLF
jgi:superfamily I DNA/RNA helicase